MSATQDYVALDWIKGEVSQTLDQARHALEAAAESPDDTPTLRWRPCEGRTSHAIAGVGPGP